MEDLRDDFRGPAIAGFTISTVISLFVILVAIVFFISRRIRTGK
jgi:Tfp pilus assembly protein PilW